VVSGSVVDSKFSKDYQPQRSASAAAGALADKNSTKKGTCGFGFRPVRSVRRAGAGQGGGRPDAREARLWPAGQAPHSLSRWADERFIRGIIPHVCGNTIKHVNNRFEPR
jgi:hypothetical protein